MTRTPLRLLLLDPNFVTRIALTSRLEATGFMVRAEKAASTAARVASGSQWDLIVASASLPPHDLEAFLETLTMTDCKSILCVVVEGDDKERPEIAARFKARAIPHPVRPQALEEFLAPRASGSQPHEQAFFRTA